MSEAVHISNVLDEVMAGISERVALRRRLDALLGRIDQTQARIAELRRELGPEVEAETRGMPLTQVEVF